MSESEYDRMIVRRDLIARAEAAEKALAEERAKVATLEATCAQHKVGLS